MASHRFLAGLFGLSLLWLSGCGGGPNGGTNTTISQSVAVTISPTSANLLLGNTQQFTATVTGTSNTAVTWTVNGVSGGNSTLGTVSTSGLYTAPSAVPNPSTVTITATSAADATKFVSATVTITTIQVTVSPTTAIVQTGATQQFTATVTNTSNAEVTWSINGINGGNSTIGTISVTGLYTAPAAVPNPGTVTLRATSVADTTKSATATVTVKVPPPIQVTITPTTASVQVGTAQQFTATVMNVTNTAVTWSVNGINGGNSTVGTISTTGLYAAPAAVPNPNSITVRATSVADATKYATATVTVTSGPPQLTFAFVGPIDMPWQSAGPIAAAGHFDSDGFIDLAVTDLDPIQVHLLFGSGSGDFPVKSSIDLPAKSVVAGDFNGDGSTDLAFTTLPIGPVLALTEVSVLTGDGQGLFTPRWAYPFGINSPCEQSLNGFVGPIAIADLNKDGKPDLIVGHAGFSIFLGTGNVTNLFTHFADFGCNSGVDSGSTTILVGDFNKDGNPDVAIVDKALNLLTVWLGDGTGNFTALASISGAFLGPAAVGDFDHDGNLDIAVKATGATTRVYFGAGNGAFNASVTITDPGMDPFGSAVSVLAAADFNGDGRSDLVFSGADSSLLTVLVMYLSGSNRTFVPATFFGCGSCRGVSFDGGSYTVVVADVNGDGKPDVLVTGNFQLVEMLSK